MLLQHLLN